MTVVRVSVRQFVYCAITAGMLIGCLPWAELSAQVVSATVSGSVVDASGGVTPHVRISIKNLATGIITNAQTNGVGFYSAPNLTCGPVLSLSSRRLLPKAAWSTSARTPAGPERRSTLSSVAPRWRVLRVTTTTMLS